MCFREKCLRKIEDTNINNNTKYYRWSIRLQCQREMCVNENDGREQGSTVKDHQGQRKTQARISVCVGGGGI